MHKFCLCVLTGDGHNEPYTPDISGCSYRRLGSVDPQTGQPYHIWDILILKDNARSNPDDATGPDFIVFPAIADLLTMMIGDIPTAKRNAIDAWLMVHEYDTSDITGSTLVREVLVDVFSYLSNGGVTKAILRNWLSKYGGLLQ